MWTEANGGRFPDPCKRGVVATDPQAERWHVVADNLNIHRSESLVRWVASESGLALTEEELGKKGKRGILRNLKSWEAFLSDPISSDSVSLHPQALLVAQSGRDLVFYPGT